MVDRSLAKARLVAAALGILALAGCATAKDKREAQLQELVAMLPGRYDNLAQARSDTANSAPQPHEALQLVIVPIRAPLVGDHVFYVQEMAGDDSRRVLAQRLFSVQASGGVLLQSLLSLNEPARWRDGHLNPELFKSLLPQDVKPSSGCEMVWMKKEDLFEASNDPRRCRTASRATGETLRVESRLQLQGDGIWMSDRHIDAAGQVVYGNQTDPWYRFERRTD